MNKKPKDDTDSIAEKLEIRVDPNAKPGNTLPVLADLLRALRDRSYARERSKPPDPSSPA